MKNPIFIKMTDYLTYEYKKKECYIYFSYRLNKTILICNNKINKDNLFRIQMNFKW